MRTGVVFDGFVSAVVGGGWARATRRLSRDRRVYHKTDAVEFAAAGAFLNEGDGGPAVRGALALNLFEDPTGGLAAGSAAELTTEEVAAEARLRVPAYAPSLFRLLYTPFVDVFAVMEGSGVLGGGAGEAPPLQEVARWFMDGPGTLRRPTWTAAAMGPARWRALCRGLDAHYDGLEPVMPLTRAVRRHRLPEALHVPFFRHLAMSLVEPEARAGTVGILPGLTLALANGRAPRAFGLPAAPEQQPERVTLVAELYLSAAQETGDVDLAFLGLQLLRANHLQPHFGFQKQLTNVVSMASRIRTDWQTRASGQLVEAFPKWREYLKLVRRDNLRATAHTLHAGDRTESEREGKGRAKGEESGEGEGGSVSAMGGAVEDARGSPREEAHAGGSEPDPGADDEPQHEYFTSRRREDVQRLSELEGNIEAALRARLPELSRQPSPRRARRSDSVASSPTPSGRGGEGRRRGEDARNSPRLSRANEDLFEEGGPVDGDAAVVEEEEEEEEEGGAVASPEKARRRRRPPPVRTPPQSGRRAKTPPSTTPAPLQAPPEPSSESFSSPLDYEEFRF